MPQPCHEILDVQGFEVPGMPPLDRPRPERKPEGTYQPSQLSSYVQPFQKPFWQVHTSIFHSHVLPQYQIKVEWGSKFKKININHRSKPSTLIWSAEKIERGWPLQSGIVKKLRQFVNGTLPRHFTIYTKHDFQSNTYQAHHSWAPPINFTSSPKTTQKCYKSVSLCYARNCWIKYFPKYISAEGFETSYNVSETAFETNAMHLYTWIWKFN